MSDTKHTPITEADIDSANDALHDFCQAVWNKMRGGVASVHIFTIPVDHERDADMRIGKVLDGAKRLLAENARLREALSRIANYEHACGCSPCTGQCESAESLAITIEGFQSSARNALAGRKEAT